MARCDVKKMRLITIWSFYLQTKVSLLQR